jgi:TctA family transporter
MMEAIANLSMGFAAAASPTNLLFCLLGALMGTLIGVLPGIGPVATISILLPLTYSLGPLPALIMLAGIYYGAQYGGSTTAILINMPGESSALVSCIDGHQMARQGRAGPALAVAALASLFAGVIATAFIAIFGSTFANLAFYFSAPEYFALMVWGLIAAVVLAQGSLIKSIGMIFAGILVGTVGTDITSGVTRYGFGIPELFDGVEFVALAMGLFGFSEILKNLESTQNRSVVTGRVTQLWPSREDFARGAPAAARGTLIGSLLGVLPGGGAMLSSFASYAVEKRLSRRRDEFGRGAVEGLAGPEAANNAGAQTSFIPLLTLGIPSNGVMALMMGAMTIQGIVPGSSVIAREPTLFWGLVASMLFGNLMLVIINLPMIGLWVRLLKVPYNLLFPCIIVFGAIGAYSIGNNTFDVLVVLIFTLVGYVFMKTGCPLAPFVLGFILGPQLEENLRRAMLMSNGDPTTFLTRPISATLLGIAACTLLVMALPKVRRTRVEAFQEDD